MSFGGISITAAGRRPLARWLRHGAALFAGLALASAAPAQTLHEAHGGHMHGGGMSERVPGLGSYAAVGPDGAIWAAYLAGRQILVRRSDDAGKSWSAPTAVNPVPEQTDSGADSRPKIAVGPGGEMYVTWTLPLGKPYTGEIRFSRSTDAGKSFSAPVTVHRDRQEITHRFDSVAVNAKGQVFVAWIDKRDQAAIGKGAAEGYRGAAVYFAVSDDRGASFRGDFKVADHSCECCRIALLPQADGSVLAFWRHVFEPNIRDHALAALRPDGSVGPLRRATFDDWRSDVCPHHGPSLAADSAGRLHAVWFTLAPGRAGVHYGRLRVGGVEAERRVGGETAEHADIAAAGQRIAVAWKEFDGSQSRLRAMLSQDGGESWREYELQGTDEASDQPRVLVRQGQFLVFWNTRKQPLTVVALP